MKSADLALIEFLGPNDSSNGKAGLSRIDLVYTYGGLGRSLTETTYAAPRLVLGSFSEFYALWRFMLSHATTLS